MAVIENSASPMCLKAVLCVSVLLRVEPDVTYDEVESVGECGGSGANGGIT